MSQAAPAITRSPAEVVRLTPVSQAGNGICYAVAGETAVTSIDLEHTGKKLNGKKELGIYEVNGDDLKICHAPYGTDKRANEFATTDGRGWTLYVLKRDRR